jgi:hypothetical protein
MLNREECVEIALLVRKESIREFGFCPRFPLRVHHISYNIYYKLDINKEPQISGLRKCTESWNLSNLQK